MTNTLQDDHKGKAKAKATPSASQQDIADTVAETGAAQKLLFKVLAAVHVQNNITLREIDEISPLVGELDIRFDNVEKNRGMHSEAAKTAAKQALALLKKYSPKEDGELGGVIDGNIDDLQQRYAPPPKPHTKPGQRQK